MLTAMFACRLVRELKNIHKNIIKIQGLWKLVWDSCEW
jgi:hypothetical protein